MHNIFSEEKKGILSVMGAMFIFGTIGVFVRESGQSAFNIVFFRCLFAAVCLGLYAACTSQIKTAYFRPKALLPLIASGAAIVFNWVFLFKAFSVTSITIAIIFYYTQPFLLIFLGFVFLKDSIHIYHIFWTLVAFVGLMLTTGFLNEGRMDSNILLGGTFGMTAALLYATAVIIAKFHKTIPPIFIAFMQTSIGVILLLPFTSLSDVPITGSHWYYLLALGILHTALAYVLFYKGVHVLGTALIAILGFFDPVIAIFSDVLIYQQHIDYIQFIGISMILVSGIALELKVNRKSLLKLINHWTRRKAAAVE